jgi:hypothetical protein
MDDVSDNTCDKGGDLCFWLHVLPLQLAWIGAMAVAILALCYFMPTSHTAKHSVSSPVATSRTYSPSPQMDRAIMAKVLIGNRRK